MELWTPEPKKTEAEKYFSSCGVEAKKPIGSFVNMGLPILSFLIGKPWDDLALSLVLAFNPSCIRVTYGEETTDARHDRVTVHVDENKTIKSIEKAVSVWLVEGAQHGYGMGQRIMARGIEIKG